MNKLLLTGIIGAMAVTLGLPAFAQSDSAKKEIETAHAHALLSQNADAVKMAHTHLHHVINCLVGPEGEGFDAGAGNPCKGMGNGALPDSMGNEALHSKLESALAAAQAGLAEDSLAAAQQAAAKAVAALQVTPVEQDSGGYSW